MSHYISEKVWIRLFKISRSGVLVPNSIPISPETHSDLSKNSRESISKHSSVLKIRENNLSNASVFLGNRTLTPTVDMLAADPIRDHSSRFFLF